MIPHSKFVLAPKHVMYGNGSSQNTTYRCYINYVNEATRFLLKKHFRSIDSNRLKIYIRFIRNKELQGYQIHSEVHIDPRDRFSKNKSPTSLRIVIQTLIHELTHVKQHQDGRLVWSYNIKQKKYGRWWNNKFYPTLQTNEADYMNLPWEKQAYSNEEKYTDDVMDHILG